MKRLLDELEPGFESALLASARLEGPSRDARARAMDAGLATVVATVGVAATVAVAAKGTAGAASGIAKATAVITWKSLVIGAAIGGAVVGSGVEIAHRRAESSRTTPVATAASTVAFKPPAIPSVSAPTVPAATAIAPANAPTTIGTSKPSGARPTSSPRPSAADLPVETPPAAAAGTTTPSGTSADLAAEVRVLDTARGALSRGDATEAIRLLDEYERTHAQPRLGPEATLLRVEALAQRGDRDEARRIARKLVAEHPQGPYRARLQKILGEVFP